VGVKVSLEVSSLIKQITTSQGTIAYEIGTRNANTMLRLKDGETQILAGLIQDSDTKSSNSIPGLGDIPVLGRLFGTHHTDREKGEIVLSITPHIIRMQSHPPSDATEFWYGSEAHTRASPYASTESPAGAAAAPASMPTPPPNSGVQPVNPSIPPGSVSAPLGEGPGTPPQPTTSTSTYSAPVTPPAPQGLPATAVPGSIAATGAAAAAAAASAGAGAGAGSALNLQGPADTRVGDEFQVVLQLSSQQGITRLRSQLRFDAAALQLISATVGDVVPAAAGGPTVDTKGGGAQLDVVASPEDPVQGSGSLMILRFKALAARPATSIAAMVNVLGGTGAAVGSSSAQPLKIAIRQ
jgi:general secretion pathway protein D